MIARDRSPAAMGSLALHAGVAAALMIGLPWTRDLKVGAVVPVTIVSNAPDTDVRPALEAPVEQTAQAEAPIPEAAPQPAPPEPTPPAAAPPTPAPKAAPSAKAAPPKPAPKAAKPDPGLDLDALQASVSKMASNSARPSDAAKGPSRPETATTARDTAGAGLSAAAAMSGLADELQRRWNPNCAVEGGADVQVRVTFVLGTGGQVVGEPASQIRGAQNAVSRAAAERAVRAVYAAAPFRNLPREFYGDRIAVNFNAREACS